jgi:hypothetical protein
MAPKPDNPLGYWEHRDIVEIHEQIFDSFGHPWICFLSSFPQDWWLDSKLKPFRKRIIEVIHREFSLSQVWMIKDPRLSRLMPFWVSIFHELNCAPHFVHITRHPLEVAASLELRDGLHRDIAALLWLQHVLEGEKATRGKPRSFVSYDELMTDWRRVVKQVSLDLNLEWPVEIERAAKRVDGFIDHKMRHHKISDKFDDAATGLSLWLTETYDTLLMASGHHDSQMMSSLSKIDTELRSEMESTLGSALLDALSAQTCRLFNVEHESAKCKSQCAWYQGRLEKCTEQLKSRGARLADATGKLAETNAQLDAILKSKSWKIISVLRKVYDNIR